MSQTNYRRYIRLKNGKIIDTEKTKVEVVNDEIFKNGVLVNGIANYIVTESDDARYLFMTGDLVKFTAEADNNEEEYIVELDTTAHTIQFLNNIQAGKIHLVKLYTNQYDDYILVWDKERGVI